MKLTFKLSKREELAIGTIILCVLIFISFLINPQLRQFNKNFPFLPIVIISIISYFITLFITREDLKGIEFLVLPTLPVLLTFSATLFFTVVPERWLTRLGFLVIYGILIYSTLLIENVFNVSKNKSIQLLRVARTIYYFISAFTMFIFGYVINSFHLSGFITAPVVSFVAACLFFSYLWTYQFNYDVLHEYIFIGLAGFITMFEIIIIFSFWPLPLSLANIFITSIYYTFSGIWGNILGFHLRGWNYQEYLLINLSIFILMLLLVNFG